MASRTVQVDDTLREKIVDGFHMSSSSLQEAAARLSDLKEGASRVLDQSSKLSDVVRTASQEAEQGQAVLQSLQDSLDEMHQLNTELARVSEQLAELHKRTRVIETIAFQSNMLSLNASIEAARAREHGRGFAVVADFMRKLSKESRTAAEEIGETLTDVAEHVTRLCESSEETIVRSVERVGASRHHFDGIVEQVATAAEGAMEVRHEAQKQAADSEQMRSDFLKTSEDQAGLASDIIGLVTGSVVRELAPAQAYGSMGAFVIVDVRSENEWNGELGHLDGAHLVTLGDDLAARLQHLDKGARTLFMCRRGGRSARAARMAQADGFSDIYNLTGGIEAWHEAGLPVRYSRRALRAVS